MYRERSRWRWLLAVAALVAAAVAPAAVGVPAAERGASCRRVRGQSDRGLRWGPAGFGDQFREQRD